MSKIIRAVAEAFGVEHESILLSHRGKLNQARATAIYLSHCVWKYSAKELKEQFNIGISWVTQVASQTRRMVSENKEFAQIIQGVKEMVMAN